MKKLNKRDKYYTMLGILIAMVGILILILLIDNANMGYKEDEPDLTCDERKETNQYLIKSCRDSGNKVKITYFKDGKTVQSISCGGE